MGQSRDAVLAPSSLARALAFVTACQKPDGSFPVTRRDPLGAPFVEDALFGTSCVLLSVGDHLPDRCREDALAFLVRRRGAAGFWHFDAASRLPADADDTACALAALLRFAPDVGKPKSVEIEKLAAFVSPGGRIATWLDAGPLSHRSTDDLVVAANLLYAAALFDPTRAESWHQAWRSHQRICLDELTRARTTGRPCPYYLHTETVDYAWARALAALGRPRPPLGPVAKTIAARSSLAAALRLAADEEPQPRLTSLLVRAQREDGSWPEEPWFRAPGATFGSAALSTAFAAEGLARQGRIFLEVQTRESP